MVGGQQSRQPGGQVGGDPVKLLGGTGQGTGFSAAAKHFKLGKVHVFSFRHQLCLNYSFSVILTIGHSFGNNNG